MSTNPFDVFKDDNFDGEAGQTTPLLSVAQAQAGEGFIETCPKCRGTGRFRTYGGRDGGPCFSCKGKGKNTYKTSSAQRANAKVARAEKFGRDLAAWCVEHQDIIDWFVRVIDQRPNNPFRFAVSLREALAKYGSLTDNQVAAARRIITDDAARVAAAEANRAAREAAAPAVNTTAIEQAFAVAREKASKPNQDGVFVKPLLLTANGISLSISPGSIGSKWEGLLFPKTREGDKLGFIKDGKFVKNYHCTAEQEAAVLACASDPKKAVLAYAQAWKACGICHRTLFKAESIERGIGPICAEKYGWSF